MKLFLLFVTVIGLTGVELTMAKSAKKVHHDHFGHISHAGKRGVQKSVQVHSGHDDCALCLPGWGVSHACNPALNRPTECHPCASTEHSPSYPHNQICQPCSRCGQGLYIEQECTSTSDTMCNACDTESPIEHTKDYIIKCMQQHLPDPLFQNTPLDIDPAWNKMKKEMVDNYEGAKKEAETQTKEHTMMKWGNLADKIQSVVETEEDEHNDEVNREGEKSLVFGMQSLRHLLWVLLSVLLVSLSVCVIVFLMSSRKQPSYRVIRANPQNLYMHLTDEDNRIIQDCASHLRKLESDGSIVENPLNRFNDDDDQYNKTKSTDRLV